MRDEAEITPAATRRLPPAALAGLRAAFAAEVAERLPRLRAAVAADAHPTADHADGRTGDGPDTAALLAAALRDAHALGSSAAVLGEPEASAAARTAESLLLEHAAAGCVETRARLLVSLRASVADLDAHLARWSA